VIASISHDRLLLETDDSGLEISEVYRLFTAAAGYDDQGAETLVRNNFKSLFNFSL
jgi:Tat protein secretion system quality control protein TatD with DNase activity